MTDKDFHKALKKLPSSAGFDSFAHKTIEDLCWICLHELDMVAEAEYWHPVSERKRLLKFVEKHGYYVKEARGAYYDSLGVEKEDCYLLS